MKMKKKKASEQQSQGKTHISMQTQTPKCRSYIPPPLPIVANKVVILLSQNQACLEARRRRRRSKFQKAHSERSCNFVVPEPGLFGSNFLTEFVTERIRAAARRRRRRSKFQKAHSERSCNFVVPEPGLFGNPSRKHKNMHTFTMEN